MPHTIKSDNINNTFFQGYYKEVWRHVFPEKTTQVETEFIIEAAGLTEGSHVLDLMCGYGRHSIELGKKGVNVVAIDNLRDYVEEINLEVGKTGLPVNAICVDVLDLRMEQKFDAVICMGNSLQFFNETDISLLLLSTAKHLKSGGKFIINSWSIAEIVFKNFKEKSWGKIGDLMLLTDCKLLLQPTRIETNTIIITETGEREEKPAIDYIYTLSELERLFNKAGLQFKNIYSVPGKKQFTIGDPRVYLVAEKSLVKKSES